MIVTCPNCETRYNLPDDKVPEGGAKVKCSKCSQVFKAEHPPATPEDEVEALLEEESKSADTGAGDEFDETFDDVAAGAAGGESADEPSEEPEETPAEEPATEPEEEPSEESEPEGDDDMFADDEGDLFAEESESDLPDTDDLFDETDEGLPDADEGARPSAAGDDDLGDDDLFADDEDEEADDDLFSEDEDEADDDLFSEDDGDDLFAEDDGEDLDADVEDTDKDDSFEGLGLDDVPAKKKGSRKPLGCLIILLVLALGVGAAIYFKAWTLVGINPSDALKNVPFVSQFFMEETGGDAEPAPGESPADRVRKIELKNVKQYYVPNEKVGNIFVVEGKAINKFSSPKERIKVEVVLYDGAQNILTSQAFLCGNVLSQFQLQVQTEKEIADGLASEVGILSNNTFIRPGASTPFMAVFFNPPAGVKEFLVKVVDVGDPE